MIRLLLLFAIIGAPLAAQTTRIGATSFGGPVTAPSLRLPAYAGSATIPINEAGLGWDEFGRFTLQTPVGAFQVYSVGSPAVPTLYWPGNILADRIEANTTNAFISAAKITTGEGADGLSLAVLNNTLPQPVLNWLGAAQYAGANGVPYVVDAQGAGGGSTEATDGVYFPQAVVTGQATTTSSFSGIYRTPAQVRTDLGLLTATASLDFPSIAAGAQASLTITLTGAGTNDALMLGLPAAPTAGIVFNAFVSAPDTVTIRASNITAAAIDPAAATYRVTKF